MYFGIVFYRLKKQQIYTTNTLDSLFIDKFISSQVHEYIHLLLYNNRSESGTLLTKKNTLSIARVLANKTEGWVSEEF